MSINSAIEEVGLPATLVRSTGVSTYVYINPKLKAATYEYEAWFQTDSEVVMGDLVLITIGEQATNYLVAGLSPDERAGEFWKYNARLLRCNHTITIKDYDSTTKTHTDTTTGVPCLIIDGGTMQMSDRGVVLPGFGGKDGTYDLYCQPNSINRKSAFADEDGNRLKISGNINPYFAKGLVEIPVKVE